MPYQDCIPEDFDSASTSGSSSSGDSSDEFNQFQVGTVSASNGAGKPLDEEGGLLIGNFGSDSGAGEVEGRGEERSNPQIKLIEFGAEQNGGQPPPTLQPSSTKPATYVDPFQQNSVATMAFTEKSADLLGGGSPTDMFSGVVFDPFGGLSAVSNKNADAEFGDLLGLGSGSLDKDATPTPSSSSGAPTSGGQSAGGIVGTENLMNSGSSGDIFDPFGSIGTHPGNHGSNGSGASHNLMGGGPTLMPMPTLATPTNPSLGHHYSEPVTMQSINLTPSASLGQSRKLSSPTPGDSHHPSSSHTSHTTANTLAASFSSVSHSQPNLALLGENRQPSATFGGWESSGFRGSASHNNSPRRSPSPSPMPHSSGSMGNIAQQPNQFDPFGQFNLSAMATSGAKAPQTSARPGSANTTQGTKPPTGNSYQPYYMQNQAQHRNGHPNGMQQSAGTQNQGNKQPKATSTFRTRPQSPNYNPSLFSTAGKTGAYSSKSQGRVTQS